MKKASDYHLFLAGINETYNQNMYVYKGSEEDYYVSKPVVGQNSDFVNNFSAITQWGVDGAVVTEWCIEKLKRLIASKRDAQGEISEDTEADLLQSLEQIKFKFKELNDLVGWATGYWEKMVDDHDL